METTKKHFSHHSDASERQATMVPMQQAENDPNIERAEVGGTSRIRDSNTDHCELVSHQQSHTKDESKRCGYCDCALSKNNKTNLPW